MRISNHNDMLVAVLRNDLPSDELGLLSKLSFAEDQIQHKITQDVGEEYVGVKARIYHDKQDELDAINKEQPFYKQIVNMLLIKLSMYDELENSKEFKICQEQIREIYLSLKIDFNEFRRTCKELEVLLQEDEIQEKIRIYYEGV